MIQAAIPRDSPESFKRNNFIYLFVALLVLTIVGPVLEVSFGFVGSLYADVR